MAISTLIIVIVFVGVALFIANRYVPMDSKVKSILNVVVIVLLALWVLDAFVDLGSVGRQRVPQLQTR